VLADQAVESLPTDDEALTAPWISAGV